jgi:Ca-activated chloride channel family protein
MKGGRLALLTAQLCCAGLISQNALAGGASAAWADLWRTPDQQGQALLDAGRPAQAAARFHDPRRRAYADLEAGRDQEAAKLLAPFTDPQSEYNRGNALARSGQLQAALAAYDAALKQTPADKDIRHNRDLVERALQQQRQSAQSSSGNGGQGGQRSGSPGQQQQSAGGQRNGSGSQQSGAHGAQSAGAGQMASNGSRNGADHAGNSGQQQPQGGRNPQGNDGTQAAGASGSGSSREMPGQAQRDAALAAALAREQGQRRGAANRGQTRGSQRNGSSADRSKGAGSQPPNTGSLLAGGARTPPQKPETEQQLALDQWLRQIPDSPAGLLQRKFLIEHMMRQQDDGQPQESGQ